jgi:ComF family protein
MASAARFLDVLIPPRCVSCGGGEALLCPACAGSLRILSPPLCGRCGAPTAWQVERCTECSGRRLAFRSARAAVAYDGVARPLVRAWKERGLRRLGPILAGLVAAEVARPEADVLVFVPGDRDRTCWRGLNAAEALARGLARAWELPAEPLLRRTRRDRRQRRLSRDGRRANVRGLFAAAGAVPRRVVLVDDVYTTGATASAAASALRRAGARSVDVVTLARALRLGA